MVVVIKNSADLKEAKKILFERSEKKLFDATKFCGVLKTSEDGLKVQQQLRNEWS
jgi:hypothetical protein